MANKGFKRLETEKTHKMSEGGVYVFLMPIGMRKDDIKSSVEKSFSVKVSDVRTLIMPDKLKSFRGKSGRLNRYKKAYIKLADGMKIDFGSVANK